MKKYSIIIEEKWNDGNGTQLINLSLTEVKKIMDIALRTPNVFVVVTQEKSEEDGE